MARPGVNIAFGDTTPSAGAPTDTAQWFIAGETTKGALGTAHKVSSLPAFDTALGARLSGSVVRDAVETALREGATTVFVSRVAGPAAVASSLALLGAASAPAITVSAKSPGAWGDDLKVAVLAGTGYKLQVSNATGTLETSPDLADNDAAVAWGTVATYVTVAKDGAAVPVTAAAAPLAGGDDDSDGITATEKTTALAAFSKTLGPGQLSFPGETDTTVLSAALAHAAANDRVVLVDGPDSATLADLTAVATTLRADANASYGALFGPYVSVPGLVPGTVRRVPYSAVQAGICARCDREFNPGRAAAGDRFPLQYVVDFADFTDADHETALLAGVNLAKDNYGTLETYGFRSLADPDTMPEWVQFNYARLRMAVSSQLNKAAQGFVFEQMDGAGHTLLKFKDALTAVLTDFYVDGALFGATASDAFVVDVGSSVNTPETIAAGELHAVIGVKFSPHAEVVYIDVSKVPLTQLV
jgi:hypothetical protein